jgi:hypothetical protein
MNNKLKRYQQINSKKAVRDLVVASILIAGFTKNVLAVVH